MSRPDLLVLDLGVGNLGNVLRAFRQVGAEPRLSRAAEEVARARRIVLPGVGAFAPPRAALRGKLEAALRQALAAGSWLLGICVGYQLLFTASEEFGECDGLGLLPGRVTRLPETVPVPHIGWNRLHDLVEHPLLAGLGGAGGAPYLYFVHSFAPEGVPAGMGLAQVTHGRVFPAVVGSGRVLGTQCHPERSGRSGLRLLANFVALATDHGPATGA